ncbi:unnamed protein product [Phaedon cochleariae]|uniref:Protein transport protein Sec24A n=1 Tax=Phaedon cochleariae TaxID=80249 RepID=A0A9N9SHD5_PHACE|nr:unnamed protein product [Phaedon cochleariae]
MMLNDMAEPNLNGVSPIPDSLKNNTIRNEKLYQQFNGVHSSQSSRSSSPSVRSDHIPASQLPPSKSIPQSQLPPSRSSLMGVTQQIGGLSMHPTGHSVSPVPLQQKPASANVNYSKPQGESNITTSDNTKSAVPILSSEISNSVRSSQPPQASSYQFPNVNNNSSYRPPQQGSQNQPISGYQMKTPSQALPDMSGSASNQLPRQISTNGPSSVQPIRAGFQPVMNRNQFPPATNTNSQVANTGRIPPPIDNMNRSQIQSNNTPMYPIPNQSLYQTSQIRGPVPQEQNFNTFPLSQPRMMHSNVSEPTINVPTKFQNVNPNVQPIMRQAPPIIQPNAPSHNFHQNLHPNALSQSNLRPSPSLVQTTPTNNFQQVPLPTNLTNQKANLHSNRYPTAVDTNNQVPPITQYNTPQHSYNNLQQPPMGAPQHNAYPNQNHQNQFQGGVTQLGFNKLWGTENYDLLQTPNILPNSRIEAPRISLGQEALDQANCSPDIFRCTLTKIPENNSLLQKSRLPLGVLIHPFRDLSHLPVIQCNVIVRCRACRTYINPFVLFVDNKRWKCNLCYRINELPEEFQYDPVTKTYGDPSRRPEIKSSTLEYIAPAEYMLRPPQPAVYLYLLDVSRLAIESGYLQIVTNILLEELKNVPGDARTHVGFIAYDSALHFYSLPEGITQPQELTVLDIEEVFLPTPDNLLVNLKDRMDLVADLLRLLPNRFVNTYDTNSALGAALQAAFKMMGSTGGRVTVFQASLPNVGPGALIAREDPSQRGTAEVAHLNPANDFYKRLALECSGQQIAVDLFVVNSQYVDVATISGISRFSGGCLHHFPLLKPNKVVLCESFSRCFRRYLTRKIGFEAVMRIRCTRGLSIHTFHGNFFVRSTDLLSLPNINPDAGFGMQVAIEESLSDVQSVSFQAALLYTSSKGERRIRVHTMCLPIASTLHDIINSADQQCIVGLLSKMAVDRSMQSSLSDAREAFINVAIDILSCYKITLNMGSPVAGLMAPNSLKLLPLYISALLKHTAFRTGSSIRLDDRVMSMVNMKTKPLYMQIQDIYPDLYPIHNLEDYEVILNSEEESVHIPPRLQLTARCLESKGAFLMDMGDHMILLVCPNVSQEFLMEVFGINNYNNISDDMYGLPILDNPRNQRLHQFINYLNDDKPIHATLQVIRDNSTNRMLFFERLIEDRVETALSYHEFLQHLKTQVK